MSRKRATLPAFICDKTLADAVEEKRRELSREICAEISTMDALHFILSDALGIDADWIANDAPAPTPEAAECETESVETVCDKCFTAACWKGEQMCDEARSAGTIDRATDGGDDG